MTLTRDAAGSLLADLDLFTRAAATLAVKAMLD